MSLDDHSTDKADPIRGTEPRASNVIRFRPRSINSLTSADRQQIDRWRSHLRKCGFERVEIHEREATDPPEVENFVVLHRAGQIWAEYGFARLDGQIQVWAPGGDFGRFTSINDVMTTLLPHLVNAKTPQRQRNRR